MKLNFCWSLLLGCYMYTMLLMIVTPKGSRSLAAANKLWRRDKSHWCYGFQLWIIPPSKRYFSPICCQISIILLSSDKRGNPTVCFHPNKRFGALYEGQESNFYCRWSGMKLKSADNLMLLAAHTASMWYSINRYINKTLWAFIELINK